MLSADTELMAWSELPHEVLCFERDDISFGIVCKSTTLVFLNIHSPLSIPMETAISYFTLHSNSYYLHIPGLPGTIILAFDYLSFFLIYHHTIMSLYSGFDSLPTSSDCVVVGIEISTKPGEENSARWRRWKGSMRQKVKTGCARAHQHNDSSSSSSSCNALICIRMY